MNTIDALVIERDPFNGTSTLRLLQPGGMKIVDIEIDSRYLSRASRSTNVGDRVDITFEVKQPKGE